MIEPQLQTMASDSHEAWRMHKFMLGTGNECYVRWSKNIPFSTELKEQKCAFVIV